MTEVIPAILAQSFEEMREQIARVINLARIVQIDMCDGVFVPSISWPYNEVRTGNSKNIDGILNEEEGLPFWDSIDFEDFKDFESRFRSKSSATPEKYDYSTKNH